jgi:putative component of toxin-antitoxin plasmid stabilization module
VAELRQTSVFAKWLCGLRDRQARARIQVRLDRLALGLAGDVKRKGDDVVVLLAGGNKRTQDRDIQRALALARDL